MNALKPNPDYSIAIPVFNQLAYTRQCLDSLRRSGIADARIAVVNNGSADGTREFLDAQPGLKVIHNAENRGCGFAWTQGAQAIAAEWVAVINNDVVMPAQWLENLIAFATTHRVDIASPAMCEGELDYDLQAYADQFMARMAHVWRRGFAYGVCFMVHRRVFDSIGFFDGDFRLGGYEDDEFFRRARRAGFTLGITGGSYLHHFGSVTQKSIKAGLKQPRTSLGDRTYYRKKYGLTWFVRQRERWREKLLIAFYHSRERSRYGSTLLSRREGGTFIWR